MGKITRYNCASVVVEVDPGWITRSADDAARKRGWVSEAENVVSQIKRHVDHRTAYIEHDTDDLCSFCGSFWTEGDSPHNGGCCDEDCALMEGTP